MSLAQNLKTVYQKIEVACQRSERSSRDVRLVAVSKTQPLVGIQEMASAGQKLFAENYVQEALQKLEHSLDRGWEWHFIGSLQTNKAKDVLGRFALIHSVDRVKLLEALEKEARTRSVIQKVLLQVNLAREESKVGFLESEIESALTQAQSLKHIEVTGLMTFPPLTKNPEEVRPYFRELKLMQTSLLAKGLLSRKSLELSMGTTHDFVVAIEEGSTLVRVGKALFGERK